MGLQYRKVKIMYHVLVADDEDIIREGIKCLVDYEALGFSIIGEAANGDSAYEAIRYGVQYYLTKPIDEDELEDILRTFKNDFDAERKAKHTSAHYRQKAHNSILKDILNGDANLSQLNLNELHLSADKYQVVVYEKYSYLAADASYSLPELLRVANQDNSSYDIIEFEYNEVLLLKGNFAIQKFKDFLDRYQREKRPQKNSPLDSLIAV